MKPILLIISLIILLASFNISYSQAENVHASHPIYSFFKRMEIKKIIDKYHDAIIPLSRKEITKYILEIDKEQDRLTETEICILKDLKIEFSFDIKKSLFDSYNLFNSETEILNVEVSEISFSEKQKYIYSYHDSVLTFFVDGLLSAGYRGANDETFNSSAEYIEWGGKLRGSISGNFGYYLHLTNAQFWGSRNVLTRDKRISQSFALNTIDAKNFDFVEGYARYDAGIISLQIGRERLLWGNSYGTKLIISDFPRVFDAIRFDGVYKNIKYTFMHAWILGKQYFRKIDIGLGFEPIVPDKYFAAHRLEYSFSNVLDLALQEITIYSNRSADLGYLNPFTFFESVQRSRQERDNGFLSIDFQFRPFRGYEIQGTLFFDDIHFTKWGTNRWENKYAYQIGVMGVDPLNIPNISVMVEYTRVEPFTYSHDRSLDNDYGSNGILLGTQIGPNADSWYFRIDKFITSRITTAISLELQRSGENIYDTNGNLIKNVGGDFLVPHRPSDSIFKDFLGGNFQKKYISQFHLSYEFINQFYIDLNYQYLVMKTVKKPINNESHDFTGTLRMEF